MAIITYYFDGNNGNNSNSGLTPALAKYSLTDVAAFRTIPASAADTTYIYFKRGTVVNLPANNNLYINNADGTLIYTSYGDLSLPRPIIRYGSSNCSLGSVSTGSATGTVTFQDLHIDASNLNNGLFFTRSSNLKINIINCLIENAATTLTISGNGSGKILYNTFQNITGGAGSAIYGGEGTNSFIGMGGYEIAYNTIKNVNGQDSISLHDSSSGVVLPNWIHHNYVESGTENAMDIANANYVGTLITDNIFYSRPAGGQYLVVMSNANLPPKTTFARNIVDNSSGTAQSCAQFSGSDNKIFSNVFINNSVISTPGVVFASGATNQTVYNNLFVGTANTIRELASLTSGSTGVFRNNIFGTSMSGAGRYVIGDATAAAWTYATNDVYFPNLSDGFPFYYNGAARTYAYWLASVEPTSLNVDPKLNNYQYTNPLLDNTATFSGYYQDKNGRYFSSTPSYGPYEKYESRG